MSVKISYEIINLLRVWSHFVILFIYAHGAHLRGVLLRGLSFPIFAKKVPGAPFTESFPPFGIFSNRNYFRMFNVWLEQHGADAWKWRMYVKTLLLVAKFQEEKVSPHKIEVGISIYAARMPKCHENSKILWENVYATYDSTVNGYLTELVRQCSDLFCTS